MKKMNKYCKLSGNFAPTVFTHELLTCLKLNKLVQQTSVIYDTKTGILKP